MRQKNNLALGFGIAHVVITFISLFLPLWVVTTDTYSYSGYSGSYKETKTFYNVYKIAGSPSNAFYDRYAFLPGLFTFFIIVIYGIMILTIISAILSYNGSKTGKALSIAGTALSSFLFFIFMIIGFIAAGTYTNTSSSTYKASSQVGIGWGEFPFLFVLGISIANFIALQKSDYSPVVIPKNNYSKVYDNVDTSHEFKVGDVVKTKYATSSMSGSIIRAQTNGVVVLLRDDNKIAVNLTLPNGEIEKVVVSKDELIFVSEGNSEVKELTVTTPTVVNATPVVANDNVPQVNDDDPIIFANLEGAQKVLSVYEDRVVLTQIQNFRSMLTHDFFKGTKEIPFVSIASIQFKPASNMILGYIQFEVAGIATRDNFTSENSWTFYEKDNALAKKVKDYCSSKLKEIRMGITNKNQVQQPVTNTQTIVAPFSIADELLKFKQLLDMGAITEDEYNKKKKELLNKKY